eukprot:2010552-Prymnesium_polylepis.2
MEYNWALCIQQHNSKYSCPALRVGVGAARRACNDTENVVPVNVCVSLPVPLSSILATAQSVSKGMCNQQS